MKHPVCGALLAGCLGLAVSAAPNPGARVASADPGPTPTSSPALPAFADSGILRAALRDELGRSVRGLRLPDLPRPYFISALVSDQIAFGAVARLGAVDSTLDVRARGLQVQVRVGDYQFDNSNYVAGEPTTFGQAIGFEDDPLMLRRAAWRLLDEGYKAATSTYEAKRAQRERQSHDEERPPSFSRSTPKRSIVEPTAPGPRKQGPARLAEQLSGVFCEYPQIQDSGVLVVSGVGRRILVTTEGSEVVQPSGLAGAVVWATTQAPDGMELFNQTWFLAPDEGGLPEPSEMLAAARAVAAELVALQGAPLIEEYSGPVLFEGAAAGQLVRHLLADRLSGTPQPETPEGPMNMGPAVVGRIGWPVLPRGFSLLDDPTARGYGGVPLVGGYAYDDEGVSGQRVEIAKDGKLLALLMSRTPSQQSAESNGHGRQSFVGAPAGRPSNLFLEPARGVSSRALRARLLRAVESEGLPYGYIIRRLEEPDAATLSTTDLWTRPPLGAEELPRPVLVYRVQRDGSETLVRGAVLDSLQTRDLRDILAASTKRTVYQVGLRALSAELGVGVKEECALSIVTPDLLLRRVDLRRVVTPHPRLPRLSRPSRP